ncbi:unnamed protein product [Cryptosporidium hominis]|uniref:R3H domain containing protein n=2 Tax=Cryptosporidium hominis TaxID=237895 RepID=A0A0S4TD08_CRYHO|nr:R3H domain containing protein [Cryptosporidium hominis]CUV04388.1 unnamed protein product [Cryptosporidium hominis]|eukprot:PPS93599.1 R3H domain containing protein [Cryptosporidium hominis]
MLGSRKYRRWLNNQLLINKGRAFQIHQYCDNFEFDEIESLIISSSFRDPNYVISPSIWIRLCSDDELHELFLDCKEGNEELGELMITPRESLTIPTRNFLSSLKKICSNLDLNENYFLNNENCDENILAENFANINLKNCITGYLSKIFQEVLSLLDRDDLVRFISNIENLIIELIQNNELQKQEKLHENVHKLVIISEKDCKMMKVYNIKDENVDNSFCFLSSEFESYLNSCQSSNSIIIKGCNKLLRKIIHCLCDHYCIISRSISTIGNNNNNNNKRNHEKTMILSLPKSSNIITLPKAKITTLLKINQHYSKKQFNSISNWY